MKDRIVERHDNFPLFEGSVVTTIEMTILTGNCFDGLISFPPFFGPCRQKAGSGEQQAKSAKRYSKAMQKPVRLPFKYLC